MSTRCQIAFCHDKPSYKSRDALVYRHSDGYPSGAGADLLKFFDDVKKATRDTRFNDPEYLAARFVVWLTMQYANSRYEGGAMLGQIGIGVSQELHGDIEYLYLVVCKNGEAPEVFVHRKFNDRKPTDDAMPLSDLLKEDE